MTLYAQGFFAVEPGMVIIISTLAGMTAGTGQILAGSRVVDIFAYGMGENAVFPVTLTAYLVDRRLGHGRVVGAVGRMAVITGICHYMTEFCRIMAFKSCSMTLATDMTLLALKQSGIVTGMRGMAGHAAVVFIAHKVIVG